MGVQGGVGKNNLGADPDFILPLQVPVIEPSSGWVSLRLRELWEYRELIYFLMWRDIKVRYKQTALGAAWAVIQHFFAMIVFRLFFGPPGKRWITCGLSAL